MAKHVKRFFRYRELLFELIKRDIKVKYRGSVLGIFWSMLNPLLTMIVLTIVFSALFKHNIKHFPVYILTGRILYQYFSDSTKSALTSISTNGSLIKKVYIPRYILTLSEICSQFIIFIISLIPLFIVMEVLGPHVEWIDFLIVIPLFFLFFMTIGIGMFVASVTVFFRDVEHFYGVLLMIIMYMSAIFYPISIVPHKFLPIMKLNPLYYPIDTFRVIILERHFPPLSSIIIMAVLAIVYMVVGIFIFNRLKDKFIHHI